jgi:8-oxo-dGTP diphosphatase
MTLSSKAFKSRIQQEDLYSIPIDEFFKTAFSVDCVILGYHEGEMKTLLIQRGTDPFENFWALPGDLVYPYEDLDSAASRVLKDLTSLSEIQIRQVHTFGKVDRHPLGRVITVAYLALVETTDLKPLPSSWAKQTKWHSLKKIPKLAFDHRDILDESLEELKMMAASEPIWHKVLPEKFTLSQLQLFYETVLQKKYDKGNFRKKIKEMKFLQRLDEVQSNVSHRPSALYSMDMKKYNDQKEEGFELEF